MGTRREYRSDDIMVSYDAELCIHAAECVRGAHAVFDTQARPWIQPANDTADHIAEVVRRCPTGALQYTRLDSSPEEAADDPLTVTPQRDGPLYLRGDIVLEDDQGNVITHMSRVTLCRCGDSKNKPFCDNTHRERGFSAPTFVPRDPRA